MRRSNMSDDLYIRILVESNGCIVTCVSHWLREDSPDKEQTSFNEEEEDMIGGRGRHHGMKIR